MRKWLTAAVLVYFLYGLFMYGYIFMGGSTGVPEAYQGSAADPQTFMNSRELILSEDYSKIKNFLFFITIPFEWFIFIVALISGLSKKMQSWSESTSKFLFVQSAVFTFWLTLLVTAVTLPVEWISYKISYTFQISAQSTSSWFKDQLIDFWVNFGMMIFIVFVLFWLIRKFEKRWWLYAWFLSIPFTLFMMFLQPVVIDPLYNDFYPLKNKELEEKILSLAEQADIPAEHVYEVNMSEKTNALNAYVTGISSNSRIVLWDTTLNKLSDEEILFIMAHEMGHYVMNHIYIGIAGYLAISLLGLYLVNRLLNLIILRFGDTLHLTSKKQLASLPLLLMLVGILTFASSPFSNAVSRYQEKKADMYAIEMTADSEAAIKTFQELSKAGLSQVHPPLLVKLFRYGHPTMLERITYLEEADPKN
ncbi:M48 family metallopeptidase [Metabacillus arenae]|uniref:M48 family metallopeptidase n=1 Tax=Metabacillus arenae TaxID=2771434 RepID=A0A926S153_9BACI|nr:M48 family metallopeptidase [Metabacillus arenae]MBD1380674.1 M48 family metallopeptidase [Metabacillus arenae]